MENEFISALTSNLNSSDIRTLGLRHFISYMIDRGSQFTSNRYRITNQVTSSSITNLSQFLSSLSPSHVSLVPNCYHDGNGMLSIRGIITNLLVNVDTRLEVDRAFAVFGKSGNYRLVFKLSYLNDSDSSLPLKVTSVTLSMVSS
ncbi:MAG: hypothetical protein QXF12_02565 [Candidatus Aenigmatarchaeota archaeon]